MATRATRTFPVLAKRGLTRALSFRPLRAIARRARTWSGLLVLTYHRIGNGRQSTFDRGLWSADADDFAEQIRFCKSELDVIAATDLPAVKGRKGRYALITFDDGYRDNYEVAFPIIKREGVPATFFVTTGFLDDPQLPWWDEIAWMVRTSSRGSIDVNDWLPAPIVFDEPDREAAVRTLLRTCKAIAADRTNEYLDAIAIATGTGRYRASGQDVWMTWAMLRAMHDAGMTIGGHTATHPVLSRAPIERQLVEVQACVRRISEEIREPVRFFSYPVGGRKAFNATTRACLREAGIEFAFSDYGGIRTFDDWDDYDIRRIPIESDVTAAAFQSIVQVPHLVG